MIQPGPDNLAPEESSELQGSADTPPAPPPHQPSAPAPAQQQDPVPDLQDPRPNPAEEIAPATGFQRIAGQDVRAASDPDPHSDTNADATERAEHPAQDPQDELPPVAPDQAAPGSPAAGGPEPGRSRGRRRILDLSQAKLAQAVGATTGEPEATSDSAEEPVASEPEPGPDGPDEEPGAEEESLSEAESEAQLAELRRTLEALLFAAEAPLSVREMARAASSKSATVRKLIRVIRESYDQQQTPWQLAEVAEGYRLVTRPQYFPALSKLKAQTAQRKLTQAALETLALIAYSKEPVSRAEIESVRGVGAGQLLRILLDRRLIRIAGRGPGLGQPLLYGVSSEFLEHFGLRSTDELPRAGEFKNA